MGRDKLFRILRANHMLIIPKKSYHITTDSHHRFRKHKNLVNTMEIEKSDTIWVSDITYIRTINGFCYLALITDMYSRKIVGYDISNSLELKGCVRALNKALYQAKNIKHLIHHFIESQYSTPFRKQLIIRHLRSISVLYK